MTDNPPAFPFQGSHDCYKGQPEYGMTLRDYFAATALGGIYDDAEEGEDFSDVARRAYRLADYMLAAGKEQP